MMQTRPYQTEALDGIRKESGKMNRTEFISLGSLIVCVTCLLVAGHIESAATMPIFGVVLGYCCGRK